MNKIERAVLKRIFKKEVLQGHFHAERITGLYAMIREACEKEFTEDNVPTLDAFLRERFDVTQKGGKS